MAITQPKVIRPCSNFRLSGLFFYFLCCIDLIFGMWLYLDELQFKLDNVKFEQKIQVQGP
jgi:flagellar biosynthesis protein FlhB